MRLGGNGGGGQGAAGDGRIDSARRDSQARAVPRDQGYKSPLGQPFFKTGGDAVELVLGASAAEKWAAAITSPPPPLARKLGITEKTVVRTIGGVEDEDLKAAVAEAARVSPKGADLIVACVDTPESVRTALKEARAALAKGVPIWMVYAKGPGHPLNEAAIRGFLRGEGLMDTKAASVSSALTALRFSKAQAR